MKNRTSEHFIQQTCLVAVLLFCLQPAAPAHGFINPAQTEVTQLKAGQSVEQEIADNRQLMDENDEARPTVSHWSR